MGTCVDVVSCNGINDYLVYFIRYISFQRSISFSEKNLPTFLCNESTNAQQKKLSATLMRWRKLLWKRVKTNFHDYESFGQLVFD
ncbi:MAG: hypothetical protein C5B54_10635 [Acidobacteria bacterium]|nr:MAG: hypothetical protein C5B54_10635 [Acidobacteriota bacterium]